MNTVQMALESLEELREIVQAASQEQLDALMDSLLKADRVFVAAAGRSLLSMKCFAMRLMQIGFTSYLVGEVCTPSIGKGDLLVIGSGSGETAGMLAIAKKAQHVGAALAVLTKNPASAIASRADVVVCLNSPAPIQEGAADPQGWREEDYKSVRPSGNPFEQAVLVVCDALVCSLMQRLGRGTGYLLQMHANLE